MKTNLLLLVVLFAIAACNSTPKEQLTLPEQAFNAQSRYALMWIKPCTAKILRGCDADHGRTTEANYVVHGSVGQVDLKQEYEDSVALSASIARINAKDSVQMHFLKALDKDLSARGLNVVAVAKPVHEGALRKRSSTKVLFSDVPLVSATQFPLQLKANTFDFSSLYDRLDADYLIVMELLRFGVEQHYGPTGKPTGNPQVVSAIRMTMHEQASGQMIFDDFAYDVVLAEDNWDNPPLYESLEALLMQTLESAIGSAKLNLLK